MFEPALTDQTTMPNGTRRQLTTGVLWVGVFTAILAAWVALFFIVRANPAQEFGDLPADIWASLCLSADAASFPALAAMWALMTAEMMLPTFVPAMRTWLQLPTTGAGGAALLVAGYLGVWLAVALLGAGAQLALARAGYIAPDGRLTATLLAAGLLIGAGTYQFSALKEACLSKCRMPLTFFLERWRPGPGPALLMGAELGAACLGCCWALMALAFVGGTMNLWWMGAATLFMILEKLPDIGRPLTRPLGGALILWGMATAAFAF